MNGEGLVSIIVPVYNSVPYIGECVESALAQTYEKLELILIDDGSTDGSRELCEKLSGEDKRVRLICQEHRGVSAARNAGMREAGGEYIFFLDSDDAIHPLLIEELVRQIRNSGAELALCDFRKLSDKRMRETMSRASERDARPQWKIIEQAESERWFHVIRPKALHCIGGSLLRRNAIGSLRFNEKLLNGEDTLFIYYLICKHIRIAYSEREWYYYRVNARSTLYNASLIGGSRYYEGSETIRDAEFAKGNLSYALPWECLFVYQLTRNFYGMQKRKDTEGCERLKMRAAAERKHSLFSRIDRSTKLLFYSCFLCYPIYLPLEKLISALWRMGNAKRKC